MVWYTSQKIFECITNFLSTLVKNCTYFLFFWSSLLVCHSSEKKFFAQWNCPFSEKLQNLSYMNIYNFYEYENPYIIHFNFKQFCPCYTFHQALASYYWSVLFFIILMSYPTYPFKLSILTISYYIFFRSELHNTNLEDVHLLEILQTKDKQVSF